MNAFKAIGIDTIGRCLRIGCSRMARSDRMSSELNIRRSQVVSVIAPRRRINNVASVVSAERRNGSTLDELVKKLGNIPLERIITDPPPGTATEADVLIYAEAAEKKLCELVFGVLVEKTMGWRESFFATRLAAWISEFVSARNLGIVTGADGTIRLFPGRVRIPDIAFVSWDRLPERTMPDQPIPDLAPDLAVEVLSKGNTPAEMESKRSDYFLTGVRLVWEVDPEKQKVAVFKTARTSKLLGIRDELEGGD